MTTKPRAIGRPDLRAILLCERIIEEKDGSLSIFRIIDSVTITVPPGTPIDRPLSPPPFEMSALISLTAGSARGEHHFVVDVLAPTGAKSKQSNVPFTAFFENENAAANFVLRMNATFPIAGQYRLTITRRGEKQPFGTAPVQVIYKVAMPPEAHPA